jgi:hypothetical protein
MPVLVSKEFSKIKRYECVNAGRSNLVNSFQNNLTRINNESVQVENESSSAGLSWLAAWQWRSSRGLSRGRHQGTQNPWRGDGIESTTMTKARANVRSNTCYGMDQISITQCDLRRTIQVSDSAKKYLITPMESGDSAGSTATAPSASASGPSRRGGVITSVITSTDTGERKEMFGFNARHVKTSIRMESSADACNLLNMHLEQDRWYIDLNFGLNCELGSRPPIMGRPPGRLPGSLSAGMGHWPHGLPLIETTFGDQTAESSIDDQEADLSRQPLDAALFDIPEGYTETSNSQDLYETPVR